MTDLPKKANVAIIGCGIVGNSLVHHLAKLGWKDMVQLDKGPLPNPGGSTGHASNFIFPVDYSKEMTEITLDSIKQYIELGVLRESGGIELARTPERQEELKRRMSAAKAWGIDSELVSPEGVKKLFPWVDTKRILGGFHTPSVSVVDSLRAGTLMREGAVESGALSVFPNTEITAIDVTNGRVTGLKTNRGDMECEYVIVACGVWSPRIARMAGASIPLIPVVHQMIDVGPIKEFEHTKSEIEYPILRDMSTLMYERQAGRNLEIGSYAHRPILHPSDTIPSIDEAKLSPTEMPFTKDDFDPQLADAIDLLPEMLDKDDIEIQYAINGLISLTADGHPVLGETNEVKHLWSVAAVWIKEGPGIGRMIAEWMTHGEAEISTQHFDISRFYDYAHTPKHVIGRACEGFNKIYGIVHPTEQWESNRPIRMSPFYHQAKELGAVFFETAGWERPWWYESNAKLVDKYADQIAKRPNEWDSRWWSPIVSAEHLAMREAAGMVDLTAFAIFDIEGAGAADYVQKMAMAQMNKNMGRAVYTPILDEEGCFRSDLTILRRGETSFRIITGGADGNRDKKWFEDHLPEDGSVQLHDQTSAICTLGLWGPKARDILSAVTSDDVSHEGFPFGTVKDITIGTVTVSALRISYVGDLGWELHIPMEQGHEVWNALWEAGQPKGLVPMGIGVYGTTGRIEKGYRLMGAELEHAYNVIEAGLQRKKVKSQDFIGKEAHLEHREEEPAATLCTLSVTDHTSSSGEARYMLGGEPILTKDGERIVDTKGRSSYVTTAGSAPSLGKHLLMAYLPPQHAKVGEELQVYYFDELYPVKVEVAGSTPLFDPDNSRMRI